MSTEFEDQATRQLPSGETHAGVKARSGAAPRVIPSIEKFIGLIEKNRLVSPNLLALIRSGARKRSFANTYEFAASLVEGGHLTRWQSQRLLAGRSGFTLGDYVLVDQLGVGGMGVVLKARKPGQDGYVAIKILPRTQLKRRTSVERFFREIEATFALDDERIVKPFDSNCLDGVPFLVMEYVDGTDLRALVGRRGPLPVAWACEFCRQAALGIDHAHRRGLVHRDIKPDNLLLTWKVESRGSSVEGKSGKAPRPLNNQRSTPLIKILDFGLARFTSEERDTANLTRADQVFGTPDFMAPEQAQSAKSADIRSDIFSLGCTLFFLLTGKVPFPGDNVMEKLSARILGNALPLGSLRPDAPPELERLLNQMLARRPDDRPQTPAEVAAALETIVAATAGGPLVAGGLGAPSDGTLGDFPTIREPSAELQATGAGPGATVPSDSALEQFLGQLGEPRSPVSLRRHSAKRLAPRTRVRTVVAGAAMLVLAAVVALFVSNITPQSDLTQANSPSDRDGGKTPDPVPSPVPPQPPVTAEARTLFAWRRGDDLVPSHPPATGSAAPQLQRFGPAGLDKETHDMSFFGGAIVAANVAPGIVDACRKSGEICIELVLIADGTPAGVPAPIVVLPSSSGAPNFALTQSGNRLKLHLSTSTSAAQGTSRPVALTSLFPNRRHHLVVSYRAGELTCYLDGQRVRPDSTPQGDLSNWTASPLLLFGCDVPPQRDMSMPDPWSGRIERVRVLDRALSPNDLPE